MARADIRNESAERLRRSVNRGCADAGKKPATA